MPLTAHACKGISATRRARIEAAVEAAGRHVAQPFEARIAAGPCRRRVARIVAPRVGYRSRLVRLWYCWAFGLAREWR
jgi:hypothetical protein